MTLLDPAVVYRVKCVRASARVFVGALVLIGAVGGCTVGPDYQQPDVDAPAAWNSRPEEGVADEGLDAAVLAEWWTTLDDPRLTGLIRQSLTQNLDIRRAEAVLREARARRGIAASAQYPTVDGSGSVNRSRSGGFGDDGRTQSVYRAGLDASWEIDVFGGVRRSVEAADAGVDAATADLNNVMVSLAAEVALAYIQIISAQQRVTLAESTAKVLEETYQLTDWRAEAGLTTDLDVQRALYNLERTRAAISPLKSLRDQGANALALLLGLPPARSRELVGDSPMLPAVDREIAVGVPAETLRRRPDVRSAEWRLAAQTAQIGVAEAELYPKFALAGSIGLESLAAEDFFQGRSVAASIGPSVRWRLFDAGAIRRNIEAQTAVQEQRLADYESAVLGALRDVENALIDFANERDRLDSLTIATEAARQASELALNQYEAGQIDFQAVLESQQALLSLQDQLASSQAETVSNVVRLYKALGGGWRPDRPRGEIENDAAVQPTEVKP